MAKKGNQKRKTNVKLLSLILGSLVIAALLICFILYSASSPKIFGRGIVFAVDNLAGRVAFLPKTSRQILVRTSVVSSDLKSYRIDSSLNLASRGVSFVDIKTSGSVTNPAGKSSQIFSQTQGKLLLPQSVGLDFQTFSLGNKIIFKSNKEVAISGISTKNLQGWYELDSQELEKDLKVDIRSESEIIKDVNGSLKSIVDQKLGQFFSFSEISKNGKEYFELKTSLDHDPISDTFLPKNKGQKTNVRLLVEKKTFFLSEIALTNDKENPTSLTFDYFIKDHNQANELERPQNPKKIKNPIELYLLFKGVSEPSPEDLLSALGGEVKEVDTTLLTIERLTKVILLLPKAF